jgi:myo-inositol-1(or 4)-monophosphatase
LRAEEIAIDFCKREFDFPIKILTEERGEILTKEGQPEYVFIIDPVDGSSNFRHGVEAASFSIAAVPAGKALTPQNVEFALVGHIFTAKVCKAQKGNGALCNGKKTRASQIKEVEKAFVNIDLDFENREKIARVLPLMKKVNQVRRIGSASTELCYVAQRAFDAHVDVRDMLTPENFMATYLLIKEAGGVLTDAYGKELPEVRDLKKPFNIVASGNIELHKKIIGLLEM